MPVPYARLPDDCRGGETEDSRVYRLHDGGQMLPDDCRGRQRNVFTDKDDHEGTVQPDIGRFLR